MCISFLDIAIILFYDGEDASAELLEWKVSNPCQDVSLQFAQFYTGKVVDYV